MDARGSTCCCVVVTAVDNYSKIAVTCCIASHSNVEFDRTVYGISGKQRGVWENTPQAKKKKRIEQKVKRKPNFNNSSPCTKDATSVEDSPQHLGNDGSTVAEYEKEAALGADLDVVEMNLEDSLCEGPREYTHDI